MIPITWLERSTSAPPLLPGLMAADVCTMLGIVPGAEPPSAGLETRRPIAETMPWLTLLDSPRGLPMASTICPTSTSLSANTAGRSPDGGTSDG